MDEIGLPRPDKEDEEEEPYPPWNFSWVVEDELALMAWPQNKLNLDYLYDVGVRHLVTLSAEKLPPIEEYRRLSWTLIAVDEFEEPSIRDIELFMEVCEKCRKKKQAVGVHCRMGRGRSGVMAACYFLKYSRAPPDVAMDKLRALRPNAVETPEQENAVVKYFEYLTTGGAESTSSTDKENCTNNSSTS